MIINIRQGKCPAKRQKIILKGVPQRGVRGYRRIFCWHISVRSKFIIKQRGRIQLIAKKQVYMLKLMTFNFNVRFYSVGFASKLIQCQSGRTRDAVDNVFTLGISSLWG